MQPRSRLLLRLTRPLLYLAAVLLVIEEWLWVHASALLRRLCRWPPLAKLETWIRSRSPWQSVSLFLVPVIVVLVPAKVACLMLWGHGHHWWALLFLVGDKIVGTAMFARLYQITEPAITTFGSIRRGRDAFLRWREHMYAWLHRQAAYRAARERLRHLKVQLKKIFASRGLSRRVRAVLRLRRQRARVDVA
jgi:hypothetical protein